MTESSEMGVNPENNNLKPADGSSTEPSQTSSEDLQKRIQELESQLKEKDGKYVYLYADFENYKKRAIKDRSDQIKFGWEPIGRDLLQVVDNLERALEHTPPQTDKNLIDGLNMVLGQFRSILQKQGIQPIECLQKEFDPHLHEAVSQEDSSLPSGSIVKEHTRGYTIHGRLLRPSRVSISSGQAAAKSG